MNSLTRKQRFIVALSSIVGLVAINIVALLQGIDGQLMTTVVAAIAAVGGFSAGRGTQSS
jgi:hypothetical protein